MITKLDIKKIARSMKIEIDNVDQYVDDIEKVIQYFNILDKINVNSITIKLIETTIENLREDEYIEYQNKLIHKLKNYNNFIRSPKLI